MLFPTTTFAVFFIVVLFLSWLLMPHPQRWRAFIVTASFVFYAAWDWKFIFLLGFSVIWNWATGLAIFRAQTPAARKALVAAAVAVNLGLLGYFKYFNFFVSSGTNALAVVGLAGRLRRQ